MNDLKRKATEIMWKCLEDNYGKKVTRRIIDGFNGTEFRATYSKGEYNYCIDIYSPDINERISSINCSILFNGLNDCEIIDKVAWYLLRTDDSDCDENLEFEMRYHLELAEIDAEIKVLVDRANNLKQKGYIPKSATIRNKPQFWSSFSRTTTLLFPNIWKNNN